MKEPYLSPDDWSLLDSLRDSFLGDAREPYWTPRTIELYDATFAQRIGWKLDGVLAHLDRLGWKPTCHHFVDWGCGSGVAGRTVSAWAGLRKGWVSDQSPDAAHYAATRLQERGGAAEVLPAGSSLPKSSLLVISHVVGELSEAALDGLVSWAARAEEIVWLEPGSKEISLRLSSVREGLMALGHKPIAPCTSHMPCPMCDQNADWCHFYAQPPSWVFQSVFWREFSHNLKIDLRALPFSYLVTSRKQVERAPGLARLMGWPRMQKAMASAQWCGQGCTGWLELQKRDAPGLFRELSKGQAQGVYRLQLHPEKPRRLAAVERVDLGQNSAATD